MKYVLCIVALFFCLGLARADELHIATSHYCPLVCTPDQPDHPGVMHEILLAALKDTGHTVVFEYVPYGRAIAGTESGIYQGVTFAGPANNQDFIFVRNFVMINEVYFAAANGDWTYSGPDSLRQIRFGIPTGFLTGNKALDEYITENQYEPSKILLSSKDNPTDAQQVNLERLLAGRIDTMLIGSLAFAHLSKNMGIQSRIRIASDPVARFDNHIAFSPRYGRARDLRALVESKINAMRESGELAEILDRYSLSE